MIGASIACIQTPHAGRERRFEPGRRTLRPARFLVVGGGLGGMKEAIEAAASGDVVQVCEACRQLGRQIVAAHWQGGITEFGGAVTNLKARCVRIVCESPAALGINYCIRGIYL